MRFGRTIFLKRMMFLGERFCLGKTFHNNRHPWKSFPSLPPQEKINIAEKSWFGPKFIQADDLCGPEKFTIRFLLAQGRKTIIFGRLIHISE